MGEEQHARRSLTRRDFLLTSAGAGAGLFVLGFGSPFSGALKIDEAAAQVSGLEIFQKGYPRAFHFCGSGRYAGPTRRTPYPEWEETFTQLNGIMGQVLEEIRPDLVDENNLEYFTRYKERHPEKAVFIHAAEPSRDPRYDREDFFAGHWLYLPGTNLTRAARADRDDDVLYVTDPSVFSTSRNKGRADEVGVAVMGGDGKPDWERAEQLKLVSIDHENKTITVERGSFDTEPIELPKDSYVAPHAVLGPYGGGNPVWVYNFSTVAPRDARERRAIEARVDDLASKFAPGGVLAPFDGIQFDILSSSLEARLVPDGDVDTDGVADGGVVGGLNTFMLGVTEFTRQLRERLAPDKLILADGAANDQRPSYASVNGIEAEGFPISRDFELIDWSGGLNRQAFWAQNSAEPRLNYINHKDRAQVGDDINYSKFRLVLAAALFTDNAITVHGRTTPPPDDGLVEGVMDELRQGVERKTNWLGMPESSAVHLAEGEPDLLRGQGVAWTRRFIDRFETDGVRLQRQVGGGSPRMVATCDGCPPSDGDPGDLFDPPVLPPLANLHGPVMPFILPGVEVPGEDLLVSLRLRTEPLTEYPASLGRRVKVTATPQGSSEELRTFTWANEESFDAVFYFRYVGPGPVDLGFQIEGEQPATFERMTAHSSADAIYREFENGVVFANPSNREYAFDLNELLPEASLRRIQGSEEQDPQTNDGSVVGAELTLGPKDGLVLSRE